jgi:hypothetical protein
MKPSKEMEIKPSIREAMRDIRELSEDSIPTVDETTFKQRILPSLLYRGDREIDLGFWADIAGSVFMPIRVVSGGKILFTVPALCKRPGIEAVKTSKESTFEVIATAKQKSEIIPSLGERYLDSKLSSRVYETRMDQAEREVWNQILTHYGYPPLDDSNDGTSGAVGEKSVEESKDDIFTGQYDEI